MRVVIVRVFRNFTAPHVTTLFERFGHEGDRQAGLYCVIYSWFDLRVPGIPVRQDMHAVDWFGCQILLL